MTDQRKSPRTSVLHWIAALAWDIGAALKNRKESKELYFQDRPSTAQGRTLEFDRMGGDCIYMAKSSMVAKWKQYRSTPPRKVPPCVRKTVKLQL